MNTLSDQVVEFTVTFVRALQRAGQFDPNKASFPRVRARLWKELVRLQRARPQIGFVVGPPAVAGGPPELWVDGASSVRVELRRIVGASVGGAFVLQLLQYMQQRDVVILAFGQGITEPEWNACLSALTEPVSGKDPSAEGRRLSQALLDGKAEHVSLVCQEDVGQMPGNLSWQVRLANARLVRDLRAEAAWGRGAPEKIFGQSERLIAGLASSFFRKFDLIRQLLFSADVVERLLHQTAALADIDVLALLVSGLPALSLQGTTRLIFKEMGTDQPAVASPAATALRTIAEQMLTMPSSRQVDETLRAMCRQHVIPASRLPVELQEWVLAESWVDALRSDPAAEPPRGGVDSDPVRILQKAARHAFTQKLFPQGTAILRRIRGSAADAVAAVFDVTTVEVLLGLLPAAADDKRGLLALLALGGQTSANSIATVLTTAAPKVAELAGWILGQMRGLGVSAALAALGQDIEKEETVRLLLRCVGDQAPESAGPVFVRYLAHKSARVRRDMLTALVGASPTGAHLWVARALADPDESVRIRALLLCASSGVGGEQVVPQAIKIVSQDARGASPQIVRAAIEVVVRRWEAGALAVAQAERALCRLAAPIGILGRMFGQTPPPREVLVMAIAALGCLRTDRAARLLAKLEGSKDPVVAEAARRVLDGESQPGAPLGTSAEG